MARKQISGPISKMPNDPAPIKTYNRARYKEDKGRYFPTAKHSVYDTFIESVIDNDYMLIIPRVFDTAQYIGNLFTLSYSLGLKTGNHKEINDTEEAAAEALVENWIALFFNLGPQQTILDLMDNPPRSDTISAIGDGATSNTNIALFAEDARNTLISELEGMPVPKFVIELWKGLGFYLKTREPWFVGATSIPGQYLVPIMPYSALTTMQTAKEAVYSNQGLSRNHFDKFGIQHSPFSASMLDSKEIDVSKGTWDGDALGFFAEWFIPYREVSPADVTLMPATKLNADGSEAHELFFPTGGNPNDIPLYSFLPLIYPYIADYNIYGGLLKSLFSTTVRDMVMRASKSESSEFLACNDAPTESWGGALLPQFRCLTDGSHTDANLALSITGDYKAADSDYVNVWPAGEARGYKKWKGYSETNWKSMIINHAVDMIY